MADADLWSEPHTYDPYGNPTPSSSTADSRFGYAGQHTDHTTGLIYMRARWYDPATAAFITSDPIGHASGETNLYRYAAGDPTNAVDPTGLILGIPGTPSVENLSDFAAGFGDTVTLGGTRALRQAVGIDNVDYCSTAYGYGGAGGTVTAVGLPVAQGVAVYRVLRGVKTAYAAGARGDKVAGGVTASKLTSHLAGRIFTRRLGIPPDRARNGAAMLQRGDRTWRGPSGGSSNFEISTRGRHDHMNWHLAH